MHAVARAQAHHLSVDIWTIGRKTAAIVGESLPGVDIGSTGLGGGLLVNFIEIEKIRGQPLIVHDRQANPDQRRLALAEKLGDGLGARGIELFPARRTGFDTGAPIAQRLAVIRANHENDEIGLVPVEKLAGRLAPVVIIVAHEAGVFLRAAQDDDPRLVAIGF